MESLTRASGCKLFDGNTPEYLYLDGTSFAAPIVSGALALIIEAFPGMGNTWAVTRMFQTADKTDYSGSPTFGANYSDMPIYGQGLLNIGAAVTPVGGTGLVFPGGRLPLSGMRSFLPDRTGLLQGLASTLADIPLVLTDDLGAPFWRRFQSLPGARPYVPAPSADFFVVLSSSVLPGGLRQSLTRSRSGSERPVHGYLLDTRIAQGGQGWFVSSGVPVGGVPGVAPAADWGLADPLAYAPPVLELVSGASEGGGVSLSTGTGQLTAALYRGKGKDDWGGRNQLSLLQYRHRSGRTGWLLQAGVVEESESWQGISTTDSLYGGFAGRTGYAGLSMSHPLSQSGNWQLLGSLHTSRLRAQPLTSGLLSQIDSVSRSRLELGLVSRSLFRPGDSLDVRWSVDRQSARWEWQLPLRMYRGEVQYGRLSGHWLQRQSQVQLGYRLSFSAHSSLSFRLGRDGGQPHAALAWQVDL